MHQPKEIPASVPHSCVLRAKTDSVPAVRIRRNAHVMGIETYGTLDLVDGEDRLTVKIASPQRFEGAKRMAPARFETDLRLEASRGDFSARMPRSDPKVGARPTGGI